MIVDAIKAAFAADATLVALVPWGIHFEVSTPGITQMPRIIFRIEDIQDERGYSNAATRGYKRTYIILFTVYAEKLETLNAILARMCGDAGPFENKTYTLDSPEVSGGSRFLEYGSRMFKGKGRDESTAGYEYVAERLYATIVNNPSN